MQNADLKAQLEKMKKDIEGYQLAMSEMTNKMVELQLKLADLQ